MTPNEFKLLALLKRIDKDKAFLISTIGHCRREKMTEELIEFIENTHPDTQDDIDEFVYGELVDDE